MSFLFVGQWMGRASERRGSRWLDLLGIPLTVRRRSSLISVALTCGRDHCLADVHSCIRTHTKWKWKLKHSVIGLLSITFDVRNDNCWEANQGRLVGLPIPWQPDNALTIFYNHACQSWEEIKHFSVAYFNHITAFDRCSAELPLRAGLIHIQHT